MTKAAAMLTEDDAAAPAKPRVRWFFLGGLGMLAVGLVLLYFFAHDPTGTLPGFPQVWKGGPMLLGACFLSVYGALLLILKRFSLASVLLSILLSAALTGGVHAFVYSIRESETRPAAFQLPSKKLKAFLELSRRSLTAERITAFTLDVYATGYSKGGVDFDELQVQFGGSKESEDTQLLNLTFSSSPYVHPRRSGARQWAHAYATIVNDWNVLRILAIEPNAQDLAQEMLYSGQYIYGYSGSMRDTTAWQKQVFGQNLSEFVTYLAMNRVAKPKSETQDEMLFVSLEWLSAREPDPELKSFLEKVRDEVKKGRQPKSDSRRPVLPSTPTKEVDDIQLED